MINGNDIDPKVFYKPGDLVILKLDIPNKPKMVVVRVERSIMKDTDGKDYLRGIRTRWFSQDLKLQEAVFSTKDLIRI